MQMHKDQTLVPRNLSQRRPIFLVDHASLAEFSRHFSIPSVSVHFSFLGRPRGCFGAGGSSESWTIFLGRPRGRFSFGGSGFRDLFLFNEPAGRPRLRLGRTVEGPNISVSFRSKNELKQRTSNVNAIPWFGINT